MIFGIDKISEQEEKVPLENVGIDEDIKMYVLSNKYGINGASAILYTDILKNFATQVNSLKMG